MDRIMNDAIKEGMYEQMIERKNKYWKDWYDKRGNEWTSDQTNERINECLIELKNVKYMTMIHYLIVFVG